MKSPLRKLLRPLAACQRGATAIEYGLIVALIAIACAGTFKTFGGSVGGAWGNVQRAVANAN